MTGIKPASKLPDVNMEFVNREPELRELDTAAKHGGLLWDCVFSSDTFKLFKPDPGMYLGAADMLGLKPEEVMMVAAHKPDLRAAAKCGLKTAFVQRPREHGRGGAPDLAPEPDFTVNAGSFLDLAGQLGC